MLLAVSQAASQAVERALFTEITEITRLPASIYAQARTRCHSRHPGGSSWATSRFGVGWRDVRRMDWV